MSNQQLFIPNKINVGYQNRSDTYTGKLAYVIYYDSFGKLRKEKSWQSWRDSKIANQEFENEPTEGFVLNKDVGGARRSYGWNCRNEYVRVYDPRDFEFEISIANLLFILRECDCSRGKGLEGKFVYAWQGTELVLLPTCSVDYENSKKFTELQAAKISAKELIQGATYVTKSQDPLIYLGRFEKWSPLEERSYSSHYDDCENTLKKAAGKKHHVFWKPPRKGTHSNFPGGYEFLSSMSKLGGVMSDTPVPELSDLVEQYYMSKWGSKVIELVLEDPKGRVRKDREGTLAYETSEGSGVYVLYHMQEANHWRPEIMSTQDKVFLKNDVLNYENYYNESWPPGHEDKYRSYSYNSRGMLPWVERKPKKLFAVLESGAKFEVGTSGL